MNTQERTPVEYKNPLLDVEEIFYTIQGEGPLTGRPAVFIRLSGCNLRCKNCDSFYNSFHSMSVDDVVEQAVNIQNKARIAVITGGEPFRQYQLAPLIEALLWRFLTVQIETSGSCYQPTFTAMKEEWGGRVIVVCSPKTVKLHPMILDHIDAYKYVVRFGHVDKDGLPNEEPQNHLQVPVAKPHNPNIPVYISPWDEKEFELNALNTQQAVECCLQHGYTLSLQVHKIVNVA